MNNVRLVEATPAHLLELASWVTNKDELIEWAGPDVQFPCDAQSLKRDLFANGWPSFCITTTNHELLGFGQYYSRLNHCHLCRLIIAPNHRGQGLAKTLIEQISNTGKQEMNTTSCSLFVYKQNSVAINLYQQLGFQLVRYPKEGLVDNCLYMTRA